MHQCMHQIRDESLILFGFASCSGASSQSHGSCSASQVVVCPEFLPMLLRNCDGRTRHRQSLRDRVCLGSVQWSVQGWHVASGSFTLSFARHIHTLAPTRSISRGCVNSSNSFIPLSSASIHRSLVRQGREVHARYLDSCSCSHAYWSHFSGPTNFKHKIFSSVTSFGHFKLNKIHTIIGESTH
jgi:hypothetical protein